MRLRPWPALLALLTPLALAQSVGPVSVAERYLFAAANAEREQRGLPTLRWDNLLYLAADLHAREMAARRSISHQYPGEADLSGRGSASGAHFSKIAENVAESPDAVTMHDAWMHSPGHRANLLDPLVDSIAIRVINRGGELYAVEDFEQSVPNLSLEEQEGAVTALLRLQFPIEILSGTQAARETCERESGYAGGDRPGFVTRYTSADLSAIPDVLREKVASGRYSRAALGACTSNHAQNFTTYRIAVMLFP